MLGTCSKFFKQLQETCDKFRDPSHKPDSSNTHEHKKPSKPKKKTVDPLKNDPSAPKKPVTQAYLLYYTEVRNQKHLDHPKLTNQEITKVIANEWNQLPQNKKGVSILYYISIRRG